MEPLTNLREPPPQRRPREPYHSSCFLEADIPEADDLNGHCNIRCRHRLCSIDVDRAVELLHLVLSLRLMVLLQQFEADNSWVPRPASGVGAFPKTVSVAGPRPMTWRPIGGAHAIRGALEEGCDVVTR